MDEIAVLIACYNEQTTIAKVVDDFVRELPEARIYVYDNNSTDKSAEIAAAHGALVRREPRQGKGNVVRQMLRDIDARAYIMVDADDTYPAESAREMLVPILSNEADMVIGDRFSNGSYMRENRRAFHGFGNKLVCWLINHLYAGAFKDIMTGYRAFSRLFAKTCPVVSGGFGVETDMSIHCLDKGFRVKQVPVVYRNRPSGSESKLSTFSDGMVVLSTIGALFREYKPMAFFGLLASIFLLACLCCGIPVIVEYMHTAFVSRLPLAIAAVGCGILSALFYICGLILDSFARQARQEYEMQVMYYCSENDRKS